jgi:hypothetical protein
MKNIIKTFSSLTYCDMTPGSRNSEIRGGNFSVNTFSRKRICKQQSNNFRYLSQIGIHLFQRSSLVTIHPFMAQWLLYGPPSLTLYNSVSSGDATCFLRGTNGIIKYYLEEIRASNNYFPSVIVIHVKQGITFTT